MLILKLKAIWEILLADRASVFVSRDSGKKIKAINLVPEQLAEQEIDMSYISQEERGVRADMINAAMFESDVMMKYKEGEDIIVTYWCDEEVLEDLYEARA